MSCYNGKYYKTLECNHVINCSIGNEAFEDEEFAYFIADIYVKELNTAEIESSIKIIIAASIILMVFLFGSMLLNLSVSFDFIIFLVVGITAGLTTVPIKF